MTVFGIKFGQRKKNQLLIGFKKKDDEIIEIEIKQTRLS